MRAVAGDLPGGESFLGNVCAPVSDAQALDAFTQTIRQQGRGR